MNVSPHAWNTLDIIVGSKDGSFQTFSFDIEAGAYPNFEV